MLHFAALFREVQYMNETGFVQDLIDQDDDFDQWYVDVIRKAELADDSPVRGCKVVRPYGWTLWENMVTRLDARIKETGVENASFPKASHRRSPG